MPYDVIGISLGMPPWYGPLTQAFPLQVRSNAQSAEIVVLSLPMNVVSPIRGQASSQMYAQAIEQQVQELKAQNFQKLHLLRIPASVMQVCYLLTTLCCVTAVYSSSECRQFPFILTSQLLNSPPDDSMLI